jgi:DMSO/TMAO reductase YedYZ molybdopterin-dependent catalytic subunit
MPLTRRRFVHCSLCASGAWLVGSCGDDATPLADGGRDAGSDAGFRASDAGRERDAGSPDAARSKCDDVFAGGTMLGLAPFAGESTMLETRLGEGWDGRFYTDLSQVDRDRLIVENERFYIRTFYPDLLVPADPWRIEVRGLVETPVSLSLDDLLPMAAPQGSHVLECSGNARSGGFGLLSAAEWGGIAMSDVLARAAVRPEATRVLVSGFDEHSVPSVGMHSTPGASWIFSFAELSSAFLATEMNGSPLPPDHGAPVRLYVPGWYGCTCIKWVNEIRLVGDDEPATSQMIEFASRTHQIGTPALARDYLPASMDQAAMPTRIERWRVGGEIVHRVVGILWGGYEPTGALSFSASPGSFEPVDVCPPATTNSTWTIWQHPWRPPRTGLHALRMRIDDPRIRTRRLDGGYYERVVRIDEV